MSDVPLTVEHTGSIVRLRFNRPASLNAINSALATAFLQAVTSAVADNSVRVIVLSGAGRSFMAGGDIAQFSSAPETIPEDLIEPMNQAIRLLRRSNKLVLGSVHGPVAGAGMSLALSCDLLLAADNTRFSFAYTALAVSGDLGISWALPRLLGLRRALGIALLGDTIQAGDGQRLGLVNRVVALDQLTACTDEVAQQLVELPASAASNIKRLMQAGLDQDLESILAAEKVSFDHCIKQPEFKSAVSSFMAGRTRSPSA